MMNNKNNVSNKHRVISSPVLSTFRNISLSHKQQGAAVLGTVLVLLVILGLVSIAASKSTLLETKMVFNMQDKERSSLAADSATQVAWQQVKTEFDVEAFIKNNSDGNYVLTDVYPLEVGAKSSDSWDSNKTATTWPWNDVSKTTELPSQLGGVTNPMKLAATPQYTVGIHKDGFRKGTADYHCIPVSILGASQGGSARTRTLVELKAVPKSTCFHRKIK